MKITQSTLAELYLRSIGRGRLESKLKAILKLPIKPDSEWRRTEVRRLRPGAACRERLYVKWTGDEMLVHWKTESK
jgi:hypothetical protein